jgi:hypothetical protein
MKDEQLIDHHYCQTDTTRKRSCVCLATFKHPENIKSRERCKKADENSGNESTPTVFMTLSAYAELLWKKGAGRRAKEKFQEGIGQVLADNYDEIFDLDRGTFRGNTSKTRWLNSRQWLEVTSSESKHR